MKKKINFKKVVVLAVILIAIHFFLISISPDYVLITESIIGSFKGEYTDLTCSLVGGETINTLGDYRQCPAKDVLGQVTGLLCPCVCCKKDPNNPKPTDTPSGSGVIEEMKEKI